MTLHNLIKKFKSSIKVALIRFSKLPGVSHIIQAQNFIQIKVFRKGQLKDHILIKYIFKDLFLYFLVSFLFFFMIFFVNQILLTVEDLLAKSAPFNDVMRIMFYSLPFIIAQSAPFATLVGFLMSLGGMMSNNEILIFRAAGFSFIRILIPTAILGLIISILSFFVNDYLLPLGTIKYNRLMREIMNSTPTIELESNSVKTLDNSNIVIGEVSGNSVSDIIIFDSKDNNDRLIFAGKSVLQGAKSEGVLMQFDMNDSTVLSIEKNDRKKYDVMKSKKSMGQSTGREVIPVYQATFLFRSRMACAILRTESKSLSPPINATQVTYG